jgi:SNF2 family DNA or RNA helicase
MENEFIIALTEHRIFGYVFLPYWVTKRKDKTFFSVKKRITGEDIHADTAAFSDEQKRIVKKVEEYSDKSIVKIFGKRKSRKEYLSSLKQEEVDMKIRPYIERRIFSCIELLKNSPIKVYHKLLSDNIHENDMIRVQEEPAKTVFNFFRTREGTLYHLSVQQNGKTMTLTGKNGIILTNDPCGLVLNNQLLHFKDIDGKKLQPFFVKENIVIPKSAEKAYFEKFVAKAIQNYTVNYSGFEIKEAEIKPYPALSLENNLEGQPVLTLNFIYGRKKYPAGSKTETLVEFVPDNENFYFKKSGRNYGWEAEMENAVKDVGLVCTKNAYYYPGKLDRTADETENKYQLINWLNENIKIIEKKTITVKQDYFPNQYYLENFDLKINIDDTSDWFDVHAFVKIKGHNIPFYRFRKNIIQKKREFELPNGEIFILPKEWFSTYKEMMLLATKGEEETLRLRKAHFPLFSSFKNKIDNKLLAKYDEFLKQETFSPEKVPDEINANLRTYQHVGFTWMYRMHQNGFGTCLADDMGLGKTLQTIALIQRSLNDVPVKAKETQNLKAPQQLDLFNTPRDENPPVKGTSLIVMPASLVHNWYNEFQKFAPALKIHLHVGPGRELTGDILDKNHVILTTYGIVRNDQDEIARYQFLYLILDESQIIKNPDSKIYKAVNKLNAKHRVVLTGTPIENSLTDLWAQLHFLNPYMLGSFNFFRTEFINPVEREYDEDTQEKLKSIIQPFILRRTKSEVAKELPELSTNTVFCDMTAEQESMYEAEKSRVRNAILDNIEKSGIEKASIQILQGLTHLRQLANHPLLVDPAYQMESGKFNEVTRNFENIVNEDHKVLIFSSFVKHLKVFASYFEENNIGYNMLTGSSRNRKEIISDFQDNVNNRFFLISIKAGGVGLNLTAADYVFILDPWWNPAVENQAINRAHRIGQQKNVFAYKFISSGTIEEKIVKLQQKKSILADKFVNTNNPFKNLSTGDIMDLFE